MSDSFRPHGLSPWNSPGQNTGVGSLSLLQGIFPTQGSNPGLPRCRQTLYHLSHRGSLFRGEGPPKITRKGLQRDRPPNDYKASGLLSHFLIKQLPSSLRTPSGPACPMTWDLPRTGLADRLPPDANFSRV